MVYKKYQAISLVSNLRLLLSNNLTNSSTTSKLLLYVRIMKGLMFIHCLWASGSIYGCTCERKICRYRPFEGMPNIEDLNSLLCLMRWQCQRVEVKIFKMVGSYCWKRIFYDIATSLIDTLGFEWGLSQMSYCLTYAVSARKYGIVGRTFKLCKGTSSTSYAYVGRSFLHMD